MLNRILTCRKTLLEQLLLQSRPVYVEGTATGTGTSSEEESSTTEVQTQLPGNISDEDSQAILNQIAEVTLNVFNWEKGEIPTQSLSEKYDLELASFESRDGDERSRRAAELSTKIFKHLNEQLYELFTEPELKEIQNIPETDLTATQIKKDAIKLFKTHATGDHADKEGAEAIKNLVEECGLETIHIEESQKLKQAELVAFRKMQAVKSRLETKKKKLEQLDKDSALQTEAYNHSSKKLNKWIAAVSIGAAVAMPMFGWGFLATAGAMNVALAGPKLVQVIKYKYLNMWNATKKSSSNMQIPLIGRFFDTTGRQENIAFDAEQEYKRAQNMFKNKEEVFDKQKDAIDQQLKILTQADGPFTMAEKRMKEVSQELANLQQQLKEADTNEKRTAIGAEMNQVQARHGEAIKEYQRFKEQKEELEKLLAVFEVNKEVSVFSGTAKEIGALTKKRLNPKLRTTITGIAVRREAEMRNARELRIEWEKQKAEKAQGYIPMVREVWEALNKGSFAPNAKFKVPSQIPPKTHAALALKRMAAEPFETRLNSRAAKMLEFLLGLKIDPPKEAAETEAEKKAREEKEAVKKEAERKKAEDEEKKKEEERVKKEKEEKEKKEREEKEKIEKERIERELKEKEEKKKRKEGRREEKRKRKEANRTERKEREEKERTDRLDREKREREERLERERREREEREAREARDAERQRELFRHLAEASSKAPATMPKIVIKPHFENKPENWNLNDAGGAPGTPGPAGPEGPAGREGVPGKDGAQGPEGPKGQKGDKGDKGIQGEQGPEGSIGPEGPEGPGGAEGHEGPQGQKGEQGDTGPKGDKGDKGDSGESHEPEVIPPVPDIPPVLTGDPGGDRPTDEDLKTPFHVYYPVTERRTEVGLNGKVRKVKVKTEYCLFLVKKGSEGAKLENNLEAVSGVQQMRKAMNFGCKASTLKTKGRMPGTGPDRMESLRGLAAV